MAIDSNPRMGVRTIPAQFRLGLVLGVMFGLWNLIATRLDPLAEDTISALLVFYGPMFAMWGFAGFRAFHGRSRLADAVIVGGTVACGTFVAFVVARLITMNMSLDVTSQRLDWQNLLARFKTSGFESLRAYANYEHVAGAPFKIFVASVIGAGMGLVGGLCGRVGHWLSRESRVNAAALILVVTLLTPTWAVAQGHAMTGSYAERLVAAALEQTRSRVVYDGGYRRIIYPAATFHRRSACVPVS